ncbi:hypothetical protein ACWP1A_005175, partial [Escherichia coli]
MNHYEKIAFEEANEDIFTQQQDERDETLDEYISRFATHCRDNGYYLTYNAKGDPVFSSEAKGVKEAPAKALVRGFKKYANNLGYRGAYPKDCSFRVQGALVDGLTYVEHTFF